MTGRSLPMDQLQRLKQVRSVAAVVGFDHGKMRETDFVAMPQMGAEKKLKRPLLGTAGADTFLYSASRVHWPGNLLAPSGPAAVGLPALVRQFTAAMSTRGISLDELCKAFGEELEIVGDWAADAHWPTLVATLPVNDAARGRKIAEALTSAKSPVRSGRAAMKQRDRVARSRSVVWFGAPRHCHSDTMMMGRTLARRGCADRSAADGRVGEERDFRVQPPPARRPSICRCRLLCERADAAARPLLMGAAFYRSRDDS